MLVASAVAACSNAANPAGGGGTCAVTDDCQQGYVCITTADGSRQCSNDLSQIESSLEGGADAAAATDAPAQQQDGTTPTTDSGAPPADTGAPPQDTGSPPQDTGSPPQDTGSPPQDTGSPPQDTGSPQEAGGD